MVLHKSITKKIAEKANEERVINQQQPFMYSTPMRRQSTYGISALRNINDFLSAESPRVQEKKKSKMYGVLGIDSLEKDQDEILEMLKNKNKPV